LLEGEAEALSRKAVELALNGDVSALRLCLDRIVPPRKDRPVCFELPAMTESKDAVTASAAIVAAVAAGELTPTEAAELCKVLDSYARTLQAVEFEERLSKLEKAKWIGAWLISNASRHHRAILCRCMNGSREPNKRAGLTLSQLRFQMVSELDMRAGVLVFLKSSLS
jgi:hypothetical protein